MQTYGAVPGGSQPVNKIISNAYTPTVTNLNAVVNQTVAGTAAIQQNLNNLTTQGQQAIAEARVVYNQLFPDYINTIGLDDNTLSADEFDLMMADWAGQKSSEFVDTLAGGIKTFEGSGKRTVATNNPGGLIVGSGKHGGKKEEQWAFWEWTDESGARHQAFPDTSSGDPLPPAEVIEAIEKYGDQAVSKHYTAVFDTIEEGEAALKDLVKGMIEKHGGDVDAFVQEYSGLPEGSESLQNYQKLMNALDTFDYEDIDFYKAVMTKQYFDTPQEQRNIAMHRVYDDKVAHFTTTSTGNQVKLQAFFIDPEDDPEGSVHEKNSDYNMFKAAFGTDENFELIKATFPVTGTPMEAWNLIQADEDLYDVLKGVAAGGASRKKDHTFDSFNLAWNNWLESTQNLAWYTDPDAISTDIGVALWKNVVDDIDGPGWRNKTDEEKIEWQVNQLAVYVSRNNFDEEQVDWIFDEFRDLMYIKWKKYGPGIDQKITDAWNK